VAKEFLTEVVAQTRIQGLTSNDPFVLEDQRKRSDEGDVFQVDVCYNCSL
jgi:hypothetical protein